VGITLKNCCGAWGSGCDALGEERNHDGAYGEEGKQCRNEDMGLGGKRYGAGEDLGWPCPYPSISVTDP
jgi:hypothetical protein